MKSASSKKSRYPISDIRDSSRAGFTLVEIIISSLIAVILIFVIASFRQNIESLDNFFTQNFTSRQDIEQNLQIMASEIRSARLSAQGSYPIESVSSSSFIFYTDADRDGRAERVRYFQISGALQKGTTKASGDPPSYSSSSEKLTTIADHVISTSTPLFSYYDSSYNGTQTSSLAFPFDVMNIRVVRVQFFADINPSSSPRAEFFTTTANVRNLRSSLTQ